MKPASHGSYPLLGLPFILLNSRLAWWTVLALTVVPMWAAIPPNRSNGELLVTEGKVEWSAPRSAWQPAIAGQALQLEDSIRTGESSRATARLPAGSILRIDEFTFLRIQAPPGSQRPTASIIQGIMYFFSRSSPEEIDFSTPVASGAIKGTEIVIRVAPDGTTAVMLLEGSAEVTPTGGATRAPLQLSSGEQAEIRGDGSVTRTAVLDAVGPVQWALYYPAVLSPDAAEPHAGSPWRDAWLAYKSGALPAALTLIPPGAPTISDPERLLSAALALSAGKHDLLAIRALTTEPAKALRALSVLVRSGPKAPEVASFTPETASGWLVVSYLRQAEGNHAAALAAARRAVQLSGANGYGWTRVGELAFAAGLRPFARQSLQRALLESPLLAHAEAMLGFIAAADGQRKVAESHFVEALRRDPALAAARLGLGILFHGSGDAVGGRRELIAAAALDINQSLPRSYLAKAWMEARNFARAQVELDIATQLDPGDPTPPLYEALLAYAGNRANEAVTNLERSISLNDNRRTYRSRLLLDGDRSVRRANLAAIYEAAGARELAFREAGRAVQDDPVNYSAHLFLANAYDLLRDPLRINLRHETAWSGSLLLARLLAPATAGSIKPTVGLGEYTRFFEPARFTLSGEILWMDSGERRHTLLHTGNFGSTNYTLHARMHRYPGDRANNDFLRHEITAVAAHQLSPNDTVLLQTYIQSTRGGDLRAGIPAELRSTTSRFEERQFPLVNVGYRRNWRPGSDTVFLGVRIESDFHHQNSRALHPVFVRERNGTLAPFEMFSFESAFRNQFTLLHGELAHFEQHERFSFQAGVRVQQGRFRTENELIPIIRPPGLFNEALQADVREIFKRRSGYGYFTWRVAPQWSVLGGATVDWVDAPSGLFTEPVTSGHRRSSRFSPKAGLIWQPTNRVRIRSAYSSSLGGITFEESFRLEPVQFAGFTQGVRSLIPEAVAGGTVTPRFALSGFGVDIKAAPKVYLDFEASERRSRAERQSGVLSATPPPAHFEPLHELLRFRERQFAASITWLLHPQWTLFSSITALDTAVTQTFPTAPRLELEQRSRLFTPAARLTWNSPGGLFGSLNTGWLRQHDVTGSAEQTRSAWSSDLEMGFRASQQRWSVSGGATNLWNTNLEFGALTVPNPLSMQRSWFLRSTFSF